MVFWAYRAYAGVLSYDEVLAEAVAKYDEGDTVTAEELLGQVIQEYPDDPAANYYLAQILNDRGYFEAALGSYKKAAESPEFYDALFNAGYLSYELGDPDTALAYYDRYLEYRPNDSATLYNKGIIYASLGNDAYAAKCYEGAIESDPYNVDALYNIAVIYYDRTEYERAVHYFDRILELNETDADSLYGRGLALYGLEDYENAVESLRRGAELASDDGRFFYQLGNIHYSLNELDDALAGFAEAYRLGYAPDEDAFYMGYIYSDLHKYGPALEYFGLAAELNPGYAVAHVETARIYRAMGKNASALEELRKATDKGYDEEAELAFEFGMTYNALGLYEDAAEYFADAISQNGDFLEAYYYLAETYEYFDKVKAIRQWRRYVELAEGQPGEKYSIKEARSRIDKLAKETRPE